MMSSNSTSVASAGTLSGAASGALAAADIGGAATVSLPLVLAPGTLMAAAPIAVGSIDS